MKFINSCGYIDGRIDVIVNPADYELIGAFEGLGADEKERAACECLGLPTELPSTS